MSKLSLYGTRCPAHVNDSTRPKSANVQEDKAAASRGSSKRALMRCRVCGCLLKETRLTKHLRSVHPARERTKEIPKLSVGSVLPPTGVRRAAAKKKRTSSSKAVRRSQGKPLRKPVTLRKSFLQLKGRAVRLNAQGKCSTCRAKVAWFFHYEKTNFGAVAI